MNNMLMSLILLLFVQIATFVSNPLPHVNRFPLPVYFTLFFTPPKMRGNMGCEKHKCLIESVRVHHL